MIHGRKFITWYASTEGWRTIMYWWNPQDGGYYEPAFTGIGNLLSEQDAQKEAEQWADIEGCKLVKPQDT